MEYSLLERIIVTCLGFLETALDALPTLCEGLPVVDKLTAGLDWLLSLLVTVSFVLPIRDIALIALCVIGVSGFGVVVNVINWIIQRIFDVIP